MVHMLLFVYVGCCRLFVSDTDLMYYENLYRCLSEMETNNCQQTTDNQKPLTNTN